jgi:hypothetical protein
MQSGIAPRNPHIGELRIYNEDLKPPIWGRRRNAVLVYREWRRAGGRKEAASAAPRSSASIECCVERVNLAHWPRLPTIESEALAVRRTPPRAARHEELLFC